MTSYTMAFNPQSFRSYKSDPLALTGFDEKLAQQDLLVEALRNPSGYYGLRKKFMSGLVANVSRDLYEVIYTVLTEGATAANGEKLDDEGFVGAGWDPKVSPRDADALAFSVCESMIELLQSKVLDRILPPSILNNSLEKVKAQTEAETKNML